MGLINLVKKGEKGDFMKKDDNKVDFDLSTLSLQELIEVYEEITGFLQFLDENKIVQEAVEDENE